MEEFVAFYNQNPELARYLIYVSLGLISMISFCGAVNIVVDQYKNGIFSAGQVLLLFIAALTIWPVIIVVGIVSPLYYSAKVEVDN